MERRTRDLKEGGSVLGVAGQTMGSLLTGIGVGAALMYFLDPRLGPYRRGIARDKTTSLASRSMLLAEKKTRNARNHLQGFVSEARKLVQGEESVDDRKLTDRIRSKLGRVLLHPSDIEILVANGRVVARGKLERDAAQRALSTIRRIRGVDQVDDQLERVTELS